MKTRIRLISPAAIAAIVSTGFAAWVVAAGTPATNAPAPAGNPKAATAATNVVATATNIGHAATMAELFGDPVIAKGKGFEIKRSALDEVVPKIKLMAAAYGRVVTSQQAEVNALNSLIVKSLLMQKATDADRAEGKKEAEQDISQILSRAGADNVALQLKAQGKTMDDWRSEMTEQVVISTVLVRLLNAAATDADAKKFYDNHPADFEQPELAHVRHIMLMTVDPDTREPLSADQLQAKRKQIDDILKRARAGDDFAALAKQYSEEPGSNDKGDEIAMAHGSPTTPPEIESAVFSMTNNQISDVITTGYTYSIVKLLKKTPAKELALTDKVPSSDITVAERIKNFLTQQNVGQLAPPYLDKLKKEAGVEILDAGLKAAAEAEATAATNAPVTPPGK